MSIKTFNTVEDILYFLQFHPDDKNDLIIPKIILNEYIDKENENYPRSTHRYISLEDVIRSNNYKYMYDYEKDNKHFIWYQKKNIHLYY